MKIILSFVFLFIQSKVWGQCQLKDKIISLSAPITATLEELQLLKDPLIHGISVFHHVPNFTGKKIPGGIFVGELFFRHLKDVVIFYDESIEVKNKLNSFSHLKSIEIKTKKVDPFGLQIEANNILSTYLKNCENALTQSIEKLNLIKSQLLKKKFKNPIYFLLGEMTKNEWPNLMMNNDGFVAWLKNNQIIQTMKSDLNYIKWSESWKKNLTKESRVVGLVQDNSKNEITLVKLNKQELNIIGPDILAPGWGQIFLLEFILKQNIVLE